MVLLLHMSTKKKELVVTKQEISSPASVIEQELLKCGMTPEAVAKMLLELCSWKSYKIDKNGNVHESLDGQLRLHALTLWSKITGAAKAKVGDEVHQHLHLEGVTDDKLNDLTRKAK